MTSPKPFPSGHSIVQVGVYAVGAMKRAVHPGAYPEGSAIRFESLKLAQVRQGTADDGDGLGAPGGDPGGRRAGAGD